MGNYKYQKVFNEIKEQILHGDLENGEKLPSLRSLSKDHALSIHTIMSAYHKLEECGYIEASERSGYKVIGSIDKKLYMGQQSKTKQVAQNPFGSKDILEKFFKLSNNENNLNLGSLIPHHSYFSEALIKAEYKKIINDSENTIFQYGIPTGFEKLKSLLMSKSIKENREQRVLSTCTGTLNAIFLTLSMICKPGDVVAMETPVYFGFRYLLKSLNLKLLEISGDPQAGISKKDIELAYIETPFKAIILVSSFSNPSGSLVSDSEKKETVQYITKKGLFLIEDDVYGDLYFGKKRPTKYIDYDLKGRVFYCNSLTKSISPSLKLGWLIAPKEFESQIKTAKIGQLGSCSLMIEKLSYQLLKSRAVNLKVRRSALVYKSNIEHVQCYFNKYGQGLFQTSKPQGGFCVWIKGPSFLDSLELYESLLKKKIVIAPGRLFSSKKCYNNYFRINCGFDNFDQVKGALKILINEVIKQNKKM
jgi:DNA-binding transcriptional MocR family regulator